MYNRFQDFRDFYDAEDWIDKTLNELRSEGFDIDKYGVTHLKSGLIRASVDYYIAQGELFD